jgi:hypothetical protein
MAATITYPNLGTTVDKDKIQTNFSDLVNKFGNIDTSDISGSAGITSGQLADPYQEVFVQLKCRTGDLAGGWPGGNVYVDVVPIPGSTVDAAWEVTDISWTCQDIGAGTGTFTIVYGSYNGVGTFSETGTVVSGVAIGPAGTYQARALAVTKGSGTSIAFNATVRSLALKSVTADATCLAGGSAYDTLSVTIVMKRELQSA